jgi:hypothetical protein
MQRRRSPARRRLTTLIGVVLVWTTWLPGTEAAAVGPIPTRSADVAAYQAPPDRPAATANDVLLADDLTDPARGTLEQSPPNDDGYFTGYRDGGYLIQLLKPQTGATGFLVDLPINERNSTISIDAQLVGAVENRMIVVGCRNTGDSVGRTYYAAYIEPAGGRYYIAKRDRSFKTLVDWTTSPLIKRGNETNTMQLTCLANAITLFINGEFANTLQNDDLPAGNPFIGVGTSNSVVEESAAKFNNLVVTYVSIH